MGKKVLFISSSVGLGHVYRDLAIAKELRNLKPDIDLYWLAEPPVTQVLTEAGERVLPEIITKANTFTANLSDDKNQFNLIKYAYAMNNYAPTVVEGYTKIIHREKFDLVIGDETYELSIINGKNPELIDWPFIMIWDFVKAYPMTNSPMDRMIAWIMNNKVYKFKENPKYPNIFLGQIEDIADERLGLFQINGRDWGRKYCTFVGYPVHFNPTLYSDPAEMKKRLGYGREPLIICAIGGTGAGVGLFDLCAKAYPLIKAKIPNVKMVMVAGPSFNIKSLNVPDGIEIRGYVPRLFEHFAACDLAIVLGGGTSTLELAALKRPFINFPLERHFEQMVQVAGMLERYKAGVKMFYSKTTPEMLAEEAAANIGKKVECLDFPMDGCKKAAEVIAKFI
jgi:UDP:flavonoid glycosyltransferase YjiC (YdhE family)